GCWFSNLKLSSVVEPECDAVDSLLQPLRGTRPSARLNGDGLELVGVGESHDDLQGVVVEGQGSGSADRLSSDVDPVSQDIDLFTGKVREVRPRLVAYEREGLGSRSVIREIHDRGQGLVRVEFEDVRRDQFDEVVIPV